jgi:hypothetical protein
VARCAPFEIEGDVDGRPCSAKWTGHRLEADPELLHRARIVVAMGDTFGCGEGRPDLEASLDDDGVAMMLTLVRAFSGVAVVRVLTSDSPAPLDPDGSTDRSCGADANLADRERRRVDHEW